MSRKKMSTTIYLEPSHVERLAALRRLGVPSAVVIREALDEALLRREQAHGIVPVRTLRGSQAVALERYLPIAMARCDGEIASAKKQLAYGEPTDEAVARAASTLAHYRGRRRQLEEMEALLNAHERESEAAE